MVTPAQMIQEFEEDGELQVIKKFISNNSVVFDVGGNIGMWSKTVLQEHPNISLHIFEIVSGFQQDLLQRFSKQIIAGQVSVCCHGVSSTEGEKDLSFYHSHPALSTLYPRNDDIRSKFKIVDPIIRKINTITLDNYCKTNKIDNIDFLKIDVEGSEFDVLQGSSNLISDNKIKHIQFEYGGCFLDAKTTLKDIYEFLTTKGYSIFKLLPKDLQHIKQWDTIYEDYVMVNFLAVRQDK